jgi:hypothetical protein
MMSSEQITVTRVIVGLLENVPRQIRRATDEATDEQLYYRPSADANHIAWLVWHLSRWEDYMTASISDDQQVWVAEGWAQRFALPADLPNGATGWGDSPEQVAAFRVDRAVLLGYMEAANRAAVERVARLTPEQLERPVLWGTPETPVDTRPAWRALMSVCGDSLQHTGQINYIRGLVSEPGWLRRAGGTRGSA